MGRTVWNRPDIEKTRKFCSADAWRDLHEQYSQKMLNYTEPCGKLFA
jgi:hypothetical protein